MLSAERGSGMSGTERWIAAMLLAVAVTGGALIPRLLSEPSGPLGVAVAPSPIRSVVQAPAAPKPTRSKTPAPQVSTPARADVTPVQVVRRTLPAPAPKVRS